MNYKKSAKFSKKCEDLGICGKRGIRLKNVDQSK